MADDLASIGFRAETQGLTRAQQELMKTAKAGGAVDKSMASASRAVGALGLAFGALGIAASTRDLIGYADAWKGVTSQIRQVTSSEIELASRRQDLLDISRATRSGIQSTTELYTSLSRSTSELAITQSELLDVTKTINNLFLSSGKSAKESAGAIVQLSQGLAAGALRGDEFNSVAEGAPRIMDALAEKLRMTRGELREFAATGGITAEILISALQDYSVVAQKLADQTEKTFGQTLELASNNMIEFAGNSSSINAAVALVGDSVLTLSENMDALGSAALTAGGVYTTTLIPGMVKSIAATTTSTAAALTAVPAQGALSKALGIRAAQATTATIATRALGAATSIALGPIGILITTLGFAAAAFYTTRNASQSAREELEGHARAIDELSGKYSKFSKQRLAAEYASALSEINKIETRRAEILDKLNNTTAATAGYAVILGDEYERLGKLLKGPTAAVEAINQVFEDGLPNLDQYTNATGNASTKVGEVNSKWTKTAEVLALQNAQLKMGKDEFELYRLEMELLANGAAPDVINALLGVAKANQDLAASTRLDSEIEEAIENVDNFGGAWSRTGNIIVDSMGSIVDALDDYDARMRDIGKQQAKLNDLRSDAVKLGKDTTKIDAAQAKLARQSLKAEIGYYGDLAGATKSFFGEKTAAYKAAHAIEMTLGAAEIAMSLQKTAASVTAGAAKMFEVLGPWGFGAVAAMIGVMASVGFSKGGGGGSTYNTGTGTVLGDSSATSESVSNAAEVLSVQIDQLAELRGIRDAVSGVSNETSRLAASLVSSGFTGRISKAEARQLGGSAGLYENMVLAGEVIGLSIVDGITSTIVDLEYLNTRGRRVSKQVADVTSSGIVDSIELIMGDIRGSVSSGFDSLGVGIASDIDSFVFNIGNISLKGLTGEEIQERLTSVFSSTADSMVQELLPAIVDFQKIGDGAFETLTRVAGEQAVFNDTLDYMGASLGNLDAIMRIDVAQSIIELTGGFEAFADASQTFFNEFLSESEQFEFSTKSLGEALAGTGVSLDMNRESFKGYLQGLNLADESQRKQYASLLELLPALDDYYDTLESREADARELRLSSLEDERSMLENIVGKFLPSAQATAISAQQALEAARRGDFTLANKLTPTNITASSFSSSSEFALAQARQAATLAEIGRLAQNELTEVDMQISLAEQQVDILNQINQSILAQGQIGTENSQANQTAKVVETNDKIALVQSEMKDMQQSMTANLAEMNSYIRQMTTDGLTIRTNDDEPLKTESV